MLATRRTLFALCFLLPAIYAPFASAQTVTGMIFLDTDDDGIFTSGTDSAFASQIGITVRRLVDGVVVAETNATGNYTVTISGPIVDADGLPLTFVVEARLPSGFTFVLKDQGVLASDIDSEVDSAGVSDPIDFVTNVLQTVNIGIQELDTTDTDTDTGGDTTADTNTDNTDTDTQQNLTAGGVEIDAAGVLRLRRRVDRSRALDRKLAQEMRATQDPMLIRPSRLRKVSLNRLELAVAKAIQTDGVMSDEMAHLAGLTSIKNVFLSPESGDVIIAGPAEGFAPDAAGRMVGFKSGEATMHLQDLVVALRCFLPGEQPTPFIGCSIDPTQEGLQRMQQYIRQVAAHVTPADDMRFAAGLQQSLGSQVVTVEGVPANTHFAQVLVEADYRMKLIGIGLEEPPVSITSYIKRASPSSVSRNALQRWYFQPNYDCVRVSQDGLAMELEGEGVKLVGANERVQRDGRRQNAGHVDRASSAFVRSFTERYAALARKEPVFGQLRNLIECSIVAAFMQQEDVYGQCNWDMAIFGDEALIPVEVYRTPKTVDAAVNVVWKGGTLMTPIGGGVSINPKQALVSNLEDEDGSLQQARSEVRMPELADGQWWWD